MIDKKLLFFRYILCSLVLLTPILGSATGFGFSTIENGSYRFQPMGNPNQPGSWQIERKEVGTVSRAISQEFIVFFSKDDPRYSFGKRATGGSPVALWGELQEMDVWNNNEQIVINPVSYNVSGSTVVFQFQSHPLFEFESKVSLPDGAGVPEISWNLRPKVDGYFGVVFAGLKEKSPSQLDFLYQPLIWSWKRFPEQAVVTPESYATTPAVFTNHHGATEGLAIPSKEIPYRFATAENSRFGLLLRTRDAQAKPMVMAPVLGGEGSYLAVGASSSFSVQYFLELGTWVAGADYLYQKVMDYPLERQNAMVSLNETFHNMIDLAMDDYYSGWIDEYKGYDYKFDVPFTVKNVSALHPLSIALTTDNQQIYDRRGLPILEYLMSREKYLYAINAFPEKQTQNPSHFLKGPAMELWEMASIHQLLGGTNTVFPKEMERLFGKSRQLNLQTEVSGASWKDYLARYLVNHGQEYLDSAIRLADEYLELTFHKYPTDFSTNAGLRDAQATFVNDYSTTWQELLELYELTQDPKYLDAAYEGAKQLSLWTRSTPFAPDQAITVNKGGKVDGIFPGRRFKADSYEWQEFDMTTRIQEQKVPAWHTSLVGLLPEQPGTYVYGPIMLFHQAGAMLRMAQLKNDEVLRRVAYNGILGRYNNFPGYYFTSLHTNVYQQTNYPLHPYLDVKYNAVFYNHLWPHISLLQDFLVSDAHVRTDGAVDFPSLFSPGYAFLTNKVYGHAAGSIYGHPNVRLWLPKNPFFTKEIGFNHVLGRDGENTYLVLMNTSDRFINDTIHLRKEVFKWDEGRRYATVSLGTEGSSDVRFVESGMLAIQIPPLGTSVIKIEGMFQESPFGVALPDASALPNNDFVRKEYTAASLGTITGMSLKISDYYKDIYVFSSATEAETAKVIWSYQLGEGEWEEISDEVYPFEFSLRVKEPHKPVKWKWTSYDPQGNAQETEVHLLR
ncbi:hypothetical protein [Lunatimonas salinarum]|uniref:hypothetical protein n=1 Tax=Lunatimonas salinarum TaxID=1774590 RepID=UPI001ADF0725|nr:hypothetical protein [Lunatimonas salinarum]